MAPLLAALLNNMQSSANVICGPRLLILTPFNDPSLVASRIKQESLFPQMRKRNGLKGSPYRNPLDC